MPEVISNLSEGSHKLAIVSSGGTAIANFSVTKPQQPSSEEQSSSEEQPSSTAAIGGESESNGNLAGSATETISADGNGTEDGIVHISPSTGGKIQIKAWAVVGTFLMGAFIFLRKRR